ncbi:cytochrome P450 [Ramaria rubella]|nr:cytochrome P450 [Ramaria rubella]
MGQVVTDLARIAQALVTAVVANSWTAVLGCISLRAFYFLFLHPLADVPGPKLAALTDIWKTQAVFRRKFSSSLRKEHAKYGDVVRIGPNEVSIISPEDVATIYGQKTEFTKGPFYDAWSFFGKGHFSDRDVATHRQGRQLVAGAYSLNRLLSLERFCNSCMEVLFRQLDKISKDDAIFDLSEIIEFYTYDCITSIGFGKQLGLLEDAKGAKSMIARTEQAGQAIVVMATLSNFNWLLRLRLFAWLFSKALGGRGPQLFVQHAMKYVGERQALREKDPLVYEEDKDMLYFFMETIDPATSKPLNTFQVIQNCLALILAGADTTKMSILAFLQCVYSHPPTLRRLRKEIEDAVASRQVTFPITYTQATRLDFFWACMKEAMRLYPSAGMPLQRVVPTGGRVLGGRFYPAGTLVGMSIRELHQDHRAYGKDASEWRPDRWLEGDRNLLEKYNMAFGQGTRVCLGKNISLMEMAKLLPSIIYLYDISIQNSERPWKISESWFELPYDFFCSLKKREQ